MHHSDRIENNGNDLMSNRITAIAERVKNNVLLNNFVLSFPLFGGCFVVFAQKLETCHSVISASLSISKPPLHANKGKSVSTDKNGPNRHHVAPVKLPCRLAR